MDTEPVVGIDLGTTNSEVAFICQGRPQIIEGEDGGILPSCVGVDQDGKVVVGVQARNQYTAAPERTAISIKRRMGSDDRVQMGEQTYSPQEVAAFILRALKERAERELGTPVSKAVITVPAYFVDAQRQATREAGEIAGLEVLRIINEPTAAALAYESRSKERRTILVYDLGGGTFDVSVVSIEEGVVEVLASTGDHHLGGDDFDQLIMDRLNEHIKEDLGLTAAISDPGLQARLRRAAETAKIQLSSGPLALVEEDHVGEVDGSPRHLRYELRRHDFEEAIEELLESTMKAVTTALNDAAVRPSELDRVLLVGGSTRIPRVAELIRERLGHEPHGEVDPDLCVALGAAAQGGMEMGLEVQSVLVDITPYTFGTAAVGELYGRLHPDKFVPLIHRNTKLPVTRSNLFHTLYEDQETVRVQVYQGEDRDALKNTKIGDFLFEGLNQESDARGQGILLTYKLNLDGILEVHALERASGREIRGVVEDAVGRSTPDELGAARERVHAMWSQAESEDATGKSTERPGAAASGAEVADLPDSAPEDIRDSFGRAHKALAKAAEEDREEMVELMQGIRHALESDRQEAATALKEELDEILFFVE